MAKYTYNIKGKSVDTDTELSDADIEEIATSIAETRSQAQPYQRQNLAFSNEPATTFAAGASVSPVRQQITGETPKDYRAPFSSQLSKENAATIVQVAPQVAGGVFGGLPGATIGGTIGRQASSALGLSPEESILTSAGIAAGTELGGKVLGKGVEKVIGAGGKIVEKVTGKGPAKAPTVEALKEQSNELRAQMYSTGQQFDPNALRQAVRSGVESVPKEFPVGGGGKIAPKTQDALDQIDRLVDTKAQVSIGQLEHVNKLLNDALLSGGTDSAYAAAAKQKLDDFAMATGGETTELWKKVKALETQQFRSKAIQDMVENASSKNIRTKFDKLLNSDAIKGYTPEQQAIIKQIADGTVTQKTLEAIGSLMPKSPTWAKIGGLLGIGGGFALGGPVGVGTALAAYGANKAAQATASAMARSRANMLDELIRGGQIPQQIQLPQTTQRLFPVGVNVLANQLQGQQ